MPETPTIDSNELFKRLINEFKGNPDYQQRVVAHIRAKFGHSTLPSFHNNGVNEEDKFRTYGECLAAIITHRKGLAELEAARAMGENEAASKAQEKINSAFSKLHGQVPRGQAVPTEPAKPEPKSEPVSRDELAEERTEETGRNQRQPDTMMVPPPVPPGQPGDAAALIAQAMRLIAGSVSPDQVRGIVREELTNFKENLGNRDEDAIKNIVLQSIQGVRDELGRKVDEFLAKVPPRTVLEIRQGNEVREVKGSTHWQLPQLIAWASADVPLWVWGKAGGGKTTLGYQIGEALSLPTLVFSIDPTTTVGKLVGFRNMATGEFVEGIAYKPFKEGGLLMLDEIDTGDPGILAALNALLANARYCFPNGEVVQRHKDFRVMAGANTKGCGAVAGYTARNRLDAATLNRFAILELEYDEDLERAIATGGEIAGGKEWKQAEPASADGVSAWVNYVQSVRRHIGDSVLVSPRASMLGARALRNGIPAKEVMDALLFALVSNDTRQNIINACGEFKL